MTLTPIATSYATVNPTMSALPEAIPPVVRFADSASGGETRGLPAPTDGAGGYVPWATSGTFTLPPETDNFNADLLFTFIGRRSYVHQSYRRETCILV